MSAPNDLKSPEWSRNTKRTIVIVMLIVLGLFAWRFQAVVGEIIVAAMLAYVLNPIIRWMSGRTFLSRGAAVLIAYLLLLLVVLGMVALIGVAAYSQITALMNEIPNLLTGAIDVFQRLTSSPETTVVIGPFRLTPYTFDWTAIETRLLAQIEPAIGQGTQIAGQVASGAINVVGWLFITFIISIYFALDMPDLGAQLGRMSHQSGYGHDFDHLSRGFSRIWNAYLRGQVILAILIALITWIALALLGVQNALALGLLTGILQAIPYVGSIVALIFTVLVALFQPGNYLGLGPFYYALLVTVVLIILQNVQASLLLPRVVGEALDLSPLLVILSILLGYALAGIVGVILAAPVVATLKLLGNYTWRKLLDLSPFPEAEEKPAPPPPLIARLRGWLERVRGKAASQ